MKTEINSEQNVEFVKYLTWWQSMIKFPYHFQILSFKADCSWSYIYIYIPTYAHKLRQITNYPQAL